MAFPLSITLGIIDIKELLRSLSSTLEKWIKEHKFLISGENNIQISSSNRHKKVWFQLNVWNFSSLSNSLIIIDLFYLVLEECPVDGVSRWVSEVDQNLPGVGSQNIDARQITNNRVEIIADVRQELKNISQSWYNHGQLIYWYIIYWTPVRFTVIPWYSGAANCNKLPSDIKTSSSYYKKTHVNITFGSKDMKVETSALAIQQACNCPLKNKEDNFQRHNARAEQGSWNATGHDTHNGTLENVAYFTWL